MFLASAPTDHQPSSHRQIRRLAAAVTIPAAFLGSALLSAPAALAEVPAAAGTLTVHHSDGAVDWTVPTGVYEISLTAVGGSGGNGNDLDWELSTSTGGTPGTGGKGAVVTSTLPVVPGEKLHLEPGSAGGLLDPGRATGPYAPGGYGSVGQNVTGQGGGGGAATVVRSDSVVLAVAGGGGGGGGTGVGRDGGAGGDAGAAGVAAPDPLGGAGGDVNVPDPDRSGTPGAGGNTRLPDLNLVNPGGGAGGGGGGWDGLSHGGGQGGQAGGWQRVADVSVGGGGGGGAGGLSYSVDPSPTFGIASAPGDGWVIITWTPGVPTTSTLSAPSSVAQGEPVTLIDTVAAPEAGLPAPTGTVTFEQLDPTTHARTVLGTAGVSDGQASLTTNLAGTGAQAVHAVYSGDSTYFPSTSDYSFTTVTPNSTTISASPSDVGFGNVAIGTVATKTVTLTNSGGIPWTFGGATSDDPAVSVTPTGCSVLAPGSSCSATVAFAPAATGPVTATLTFTGNPATATVAVTGTGVTPAPVPAPAPVITRISPARGTHLGGTLVTITGRNFTGVTAIRIGGVLMKSVNCSSSTTCTAVTPRGTGTKAIRVTTAAGTSANVTADRFTYL